MDTVWDPVPGEAPYMTQPDYELGVPASYFEYETDNRLHGMMTFDQQFIPESERPCPVPKNPHCEAELWRPQADLEHDHLMEDPEWVPNTVFNVYNKKDFKGQPKNTYDENVKI
jgi:hypothetical protein